MQVHVPAGRKIPIAATIGMAIILCYVLAALFAPLIAPYSETAIVGGKFEPWSAKFIFGTDNLGRDILSRLIYGARNTLGLTLIITALACAAGMLLGFLAAYFGGWVDDLISRIIDVFLAIPQLIFALLMLTVFGQSLPVLILVLMVSEGTRVFRLARSVAEGIVVLDFVEAARLRGDGAVRILLREILPNALSAMMTEFGIRFGYTLLLMSSLAFLGLGLQPPAAIWGSMVRENALLIPFGDITALLPALAIILIVVSINFVIDWMIERQA